jgi:hypothetical protein
LVACQEGRFARVDIIAFADQVTWRGFVRESVEVTDRSSPCSDSFSSSCSPFTVLANARAADTVIDTMSEVHFRAPKEKGMVEDELLKTLTLV